MKVSDLKQHIDQRFDKHVSEKRKSDNRAVSFATSGQMTSDEKRLESSFFKALASQDRQEMKAIQKDIEAQYREKDGQDTASDADGGYLVPTTLDETVRTQLRYVSPFRQVSTVIPNMPAELDLSTLDTEPTVSWTAEDASITKSKAAFGQTQLRPHKLAGLDSFTTEMLEDAATNIGVRDIVVNRFALAMAVAEATAFTNGDGTDRPYGIRSSLITPNTGAQAGANLAANDVIDLFHTLPVQYRQFGVFMMHDNIAKAVRKLKDSNGRYIWDDAFGRGLAEDAPSTLLNRPVYVNNDIPTNLGAGTNESEVLFFVPTNYIIGDRGGMRVDFGTTGTDFAQDRISVRVIRRVAGAPVIEDSYAELTGVIPA